MINKKTLMGDINKVSDLFLRNNKVYETNERIINKIMLSSGRRCKRICMVGKNRV